MSKSLPSMVGFTLNKQQKVVEYLPRNEQFSTDKQKRKIFFNLYNYYVEKEMKLSNCEISHGSNIYEVFQNKIESLNKSACTLEKTSSQKNCSVQGYKTRPYSLSQKFKNLIEAHGSSELLFDLDDMFLHLVYERAKKVNRQSKVVLFEKSILITDSRVDVSPTLLIPSYLKLEKGNIMSDPLIKEQMEEVCKALNETEIKQVYLVYPKHPKFTKHISVDLHDKVKLKDEEYRVKMIPYSFSFCAKTENKN